ncbi:MAG: heavy-metal-associated domain-containing protein [Desulfamplus sp.]|nr:heavy-metal-associated domain-containing protein [Desulfamplus sp.]MBF0260077.1 heavy-metal-associated domain-containing protein [Desulfamplus sp.]
MSLQEITLNVEGMSCSHCSGTVQKALESINGLSGINVDLKGKKAFFKTDDPSKIDLAKDAIVKAGFSVVP